MAIRRSLPTFISAFILTTGLSACDDPTSDPGPEVDTSGFTLRAADPPPIIGYPGDGDLSVSRSSSSDGGGDIIVFDIVNNAVSRNGGTRVATLATNEILGPDDEVLCTRTNSANFAQLRDAAGVVLYSSNGPWVFAGEPDIEGLDAAQANAVLSAALVMSFDDELVVDGLPSSGDVVAESTAELELATATRKLGITALLDGACGGAELDP